MIKRKTVKILSVLLCMVLLTTILPLQTVFAATITLSSGAAAPITIYVGRTYRLKVSGVAVKFYTSKGNVAATMTSFTKIGTVTIV